LAAAFGWRGSSSPSGRSGSGVREKNGRVLDSIAGATRELFTTIATRQQWTPFFTISVGVY
jgi:hypothetical protein